MRDVAGWLNGLKPGDTFLRRPWLTEYTVLGVALEDGWIYGRRDDGVEYRVHVSEVVMPG